MTAAENWRRPYPHAFLTTADRGVCCSGGWLLDHDPVDERRGATADERGFLAEASVEDGVRAGVWVIDGFRVIVGEDPGASGVRSFMACGLEARCLGDDAVRANRVGRDGLRDVVVRRMAEIAALNLDVSELTQETLAVVRFPGRARQA